MKPDIVLRGGTVVDGTGAAPRTADVAISDGVITEVGAVDDTGHREIDAEGALVTPGFVDIHTHYDGQATWDATLQPSSLHGVTTVVMGNCGVGFAPVHDHDQYRLVELMEGVEDIPGAALDEGLPWNWNDLPSFLDAIDTPHDIDFAAQVPHGALRLHVMGQRGADRLPATQDDIAEMGRLAAQAIEAGYFGFSTSRTIAHRTSTGDPTPTLTAARAELVGIAEAVGRTGKGVLQMVGDFVDIDTEFEHLVAMMQASGRPLSFSLLQSTKYPTMWRELLDRLEVAAGQGYAMRAQVAPRAVGVLLGLECTLTPFRRSATFQSLDDLPLAERRAALSTDEVRRKVLDETERPLFAWDQTYPFTGTPDYEPGADATVAALAAARGVHPAELAYDHLLSDEGRALYYVPFANYVEGNLDVARQMLTHPLTVPGLADGGAHVGTICDASFPTFLLSHWVRDRAEGRLDVAEVIKGQCADTAAVVELYDRGRLVPGLRADVNVIDLERLDVGTPTIAYDLPAGGRRFTQDPSGYRHTLVAGEETYCDGEPTGALPGRLLRR